MVEEVPRIIPVFRPVLLGLRENVRDVEPMWDSTLSLHRAWFGNAPGPIPTATAAPAPTPVFITATPTPASVGFTVTSTIDAIDSNPGDGLCSDGSGRCTLRAAIMEANAFSGADTIVLPEGTYVLSISGTGEDAAATGDLDITSDLTIQGTGMDSTIIDGGRLDRVIHVVTPNRIDILGLTIQNGDDTSARFGGGGIFNERGFISLVEIGVKRNAATDGGGILNRSVLTLTDSIVSANTSRDEGGGIRNGGTLTVIGSIVANNAADAQGGGIYDSGTLLVVIGSAVTGNTASAVGGIFTGGAAEITNSTISGNRASNGQGGGIQAYIGATLNITNSTVSNNSAASGGGIDIVQGTVKITNSTITDNAASEGGGIRIPNTGALELVNTVIANNPFGGDCSGSGFTSLGNNLDSDGTCNLTGPTDLPNTDPLLNPLLDNGGPTETHALLPGSPAIDAGDDASCPDTDQRGVARPQGAACDIGAFEAGPSVTATPTPTSVPLPPQPQGPRGTLNVIDDLGNEQWLLRNAPGRPVWHIGEPLVSWDWEVDGPTNEAILEGWEFTGNADGSVDWVLNIKPGVTFHKGWGEATSTDIKFAFTEMLKEGTPSGRQRFFGIFFGSNPDNLDDTDPLVLRVHQPEKLNLIEQFRGFSAASNFGLRPFSKAYLEQVGEEEFARNPIYAGPYEFTSQQPGFDLVLTAVSDHYRVTPGFETIRYFVIEDSATKAAALLTGQIDITALTPGLVQQVQGAGIDIALSRNAVESFVQFGGLYTTNPDYNPNSPWTTNNPLGGGAVEVRKALNYAIDRQTILDNILFGLGDIGIISYSFLNSTAGPGGGPPPWWNDAWDPHPFNPALAREILAGAGYPNCFQFNMWLTDTMVYGQTIGEVVALMWEEHLGCKVNITVGPYAGGLRPLIVGQTTDGWTYAFDLSITRPQGRACLSGGPAEVHPAYIGNFRFSKLAFLTSLCSIADKSLDPVEIANLERQIGDQQYRVFNTAPIVSVHVPFGVGPKVRSWEPLPKKRLLGGLEFAQPA